jgi:hypothetical protein
MELGEPIKTNPSVLLLMMKLARRTKININLYDSIGGLRSRLARGVLHGPR